MRTIIKTMLAVLLIAMPLTALADGGHEHEHGDTRERLEEAGFTPEQVDIIGEHFDELDGLLEGGHTDGGLWDETIHILTDPAHWASEFAAEILFFFVFHLWIMDRIAHRRHHEEDHGLGS